MHITHGKCGHLKAKWDNHPTCISCTACIRVYPCSICSNWTKKSVESCREETSILHSQVGHDTESLMSPGRPTDIGLQLGKACYPCSR